MKKFIDFEVNEDGTRSMEGHNFVGPECLEFRKKFEEILTVEHTTKKRDIHKQARVSTQRNHNG